MASAGGVALLRSFELAEDVRVAEQEKVLAFEHNLGATKVREEHLVALLDRCRDSLASLHRA
jgi:hypothetical protein